MAEIKHQISIESTPEKVYAALSTEAGLRSWWTADASVEERVGGESEYGFMRRAIVFRMKTEKLEPSKSVIWTCHGDHPEWNGTTLTWSIVPEDAATILRFTHGGWQSISEFCAICNSSWGELMHRLKHYVEGRNPGPHWLE